MKRGLIWPHVDRKEQLSFLDLHAIGKMDLRDATGYLRMDRDHFARYGFPHSIDVNRHILCDGFGNLNRRRWAFESAAAFISAAASCEEKRAAGNDQEKQVSL